MDKIFIDNYGQEILQWEDNLGNIWRAPYENVKFLGKECFEQMPEEFGSWEVTFKDNEEELLTATDEDYDYIDSWFEEHNTGII